MDLDMMYVCTKTTTHSLTRVRTLSSIQPLTHLFRQHDDRQTGITGRGRVTCHFQHSPWRQKDLHRTNQCARITTMAFTLARTQCRLNHHHTVASSSHSLILSSFSVTSITLPPTPALTLTISRAFIFVPTLTSSLTPPPRPTSLSELMAEYATISLPVLQLIMNSVRSP